MNYRQRDKSKSKGKKMKDYSTQNLIDIAAEMGISRERITDVEQMPGWLMFYVDGQAWSNKLTKTGRHKKNSVRGLEYSVRGLEY